MPLDAPAFDDPLDAPLDCRLDSFPLDSPLDPDGPPGGEAPPSWGLNDVVVIGDVDDDDSERELLDGPEPSVASSSGLEFRKLLNMGQNRQSRAGPQQGRFLEAGIMLEGHNGQGSPHGWVDEDEDPDSRDSLDPGTLDAFFGTGGSVITMEGTGPPPDGLEDSHVPTGAVVSDRVFGPFDRDLERRVDDDQRLAVAGIPIVAGGSGGTARAMAPAFIVGGTAIAASGKPLRSVNETAPSAMSGFEGASSNDAPGAFATSGTTMSGAASTVPVSSSARSDFPSLNDLAGQDLSEKSFFCPEVTQQTTPAFGGTTQWQSSDPRNESFCDCYFAGYPSFDDGGAGGAALLPSLALPSGAGAALLSSSDGATAAGAGYSSFDEGTAQFPGLDDSIEPSKLDHVKSIDKMTQHSAAHTAGAMAYPSLSPGDSVQTAGAGAKAAAKTSSSYASYQPIAPSPSSSTPSTPRATGGKKRVTFASTASAISVTKLDEAMRARPVYPPSAVHNPKTLKPTSSYGGLSLHGDMLQKNDNSVQIEMPHDLVLKFANFVKPNTTRNVETCGWLVGRKDLKNNILRIEYLLIPPQKGDDVSCEATDEMVIFEWMTARKHVMTFGRRRDFSGEVCN